MGLNPLSRHFRDIGRSQAEHERRLQRAERPPSPPMATNVLTFGATGDGTTDDTAALQAALEATAVTGGTLFIPPGSYYIATGLTLPKILSPARMYNYRLQGYGARLVTDQAIDMLSRIPADTTEMATMAYMAAIVEGLIFDGGAVATSGLKLGATYGSAIRDCYFINLGTGLDLLYALKGKVENCFFHTCTTYGISIRSLVGVATSATGPGSASNNTVVDSCRVYNATGTTAGYYIRDSDSVVLRDCISEGLNPVKNVDFDGTTNADGLNFTIEGMHLENTPSDCHIRIKGHDKITIARVTPPGNGVLVDASGSNVACTVKVTDLASMTSQKFRQLAADDFRWTFENIGLYERNEDLTSNTYWDVTGSYGNPGAGKIRQLLKGMIVGQTADNVIKAILTGNKAWDPASVSAGANTTTTVTVTGAAVGDQVSVGLGVTLQGMMLTGYVSAADTVTVVLYNPTGGSIDLTSSTLRATVIQQG